MFFAEDQNLQFLLLKKKFSRVHCTIKLNQNRDENFRKKHVNVYESPTAKLNYEPKPEKGVEVVFLPFQPLRLLDIAFCAFLDSANTFEFKMQKGNVIGTIEESVGQVKGGTGATGLVSWSE